MTATMIETRATIELERECGDDVCRAIADDLHATLATGRFPRAAVMEIPSSLDEWRADHRTARKRVDRCRRRGYRFGPLARELHVEEIEAINRSKAKRQGRPMTAAYLAPQSFSALPFYPCARHAIRTWGVWSPESVLVAYIVVYRSGDLALVSQILGHGDYEPDEINFLLFAGALEHETRILPGTFVYNRWDSGEEGLRDFKARLGFQEARVEWLP